MIKLIACDLDGTLFNASMEVSDGNVQAIQRAENNGIEFLVASGRAPHESWGLIKSYGIHCGFINLNGALVYDPQGNLIVKNPIDLAVGRQIVKLLKQYHLYFEVVTKDKVYSEDLSARIANVAHYVMTLNPGLTFKEAVMVSGAKPAIVSIQEVDSFEHLLEDDNLEIMKIIAFDSRGPEFFSGIIPHVKQMGELSITSSSSDNIEINAAKAQKGPALMDYAQAKGIKREETAAIGDNLNDESMISMAGVGVAMGNAVLDIKNIATFITRTNNEDGVAAAIDRIIAENKKELK